MTSSVSGIMKSRQTREVKVFFSSTFMDMQLDRQALNEIAFPQIHDHCARRGLRFTPVDLRWGITASEVQTGDVLRTCLSEIDKARPYFVCCVGERYGWSKIAGKHDALLASTFASAAEEFSWVHQYQDRSITELECLYGALDSSLSERADNHTDNRNKGCGLFFMRDCNYAMKTFPIGSTEREQHQCESEEHHKKLNKLKARIHVASSKPTIERIEYDTPTHLATLFVEHFKAVIDRDFPLSQTTNDLTPIEQIRESHLDFAYEYARELVGLTQQRRTLQVFASASDSSDIANTGVPLVVLGASGSSKTSLLAHWCLSRMEAPNCNELFTLHFTQTPIRFARNRHNILYNIMNDLNDRLKLNFDVPKPTDETAIAMEFPALIQKAASQRRIDSKGNVVIVIDGLDDIDGYENVLLNFLPRQWPSNIKLVVSCRNTTSNGIDMANEVKQRGWTTLVLPSFSETNKRQFTSHFLSQFSKRLSEPMITSILQAKGTDQPLFLRMLLEELRTFATHDTLEQQLQYYLSANNTQELFGRIFAVWETTYANQTTKTILCLLYACNSGLSESELMTMCNVKTRNAWCPMFAVVRKILICTNDGYYSIAHPQASTAIAHHYASTINAQQPHNTLATYFWNQLNGAKSSRNIDLHTVVEAIHSLTNTQRYRELQHILSDLNVFMLLTDNGLSLTLQKAWVGVKQATRCNVFACYDDAYKRHSQIQAQAKSAMLWKLAQLLQNMSLHTDAITFMQRALQLDKSTYGRLSQQLSVGHKTIAAAYVEIADYDKANTHIESAIDICKKGSQSPENIDVARCLRVKGLIAKKHGQYELAQTACEQALAMASSSLGSGHPELIDFLSNLADIDRKLAKYTRAKQLYQQCVDIATQLHGTKHPMLVMPYKSLGVLHKKQNHYDQAEACYKKALAVLSTCYGKQHSLYALVLVDVADVARKRGHMNAAEQRYQAALDTLTTTLGSNHPEVAEIKRGLGLLYKKKGRYNDARLLYEEAESCLAAKFGNNHYKVAMLQSDRADVCRKMGEYELAISLYEKSLVGLTASFGPSHSECSDVLNGLALALKKQARYDQAQHYYERALRIVTAEFGEEHSKTGILLNNIGDVFRKRGEQAEAMQYYKRSMAILKQVLGPHHSEVAEVYRNIGKLYTDLENYTKSQQYFNHAISIVEKELGRSHPKIGFFIHSQGECFVAAHEFAKGKQCYHTALQILTDSLGPQHPEIADVLISAGDLHHNTGSKSSAIECYKQALGIIQRSFGIEHPKYVRVKHNLRSLGVTSFTKQSLSVGCNNGGRGRNQTRNTTRQQQQQQQQQQGVNAVITAMMTGFI